MPDFQVLLSLRRHSAVRGRRLRLDEALLERVMMSPVGDQFLLHLAPLIDRLLIPRTRGRLSSAGFSRFGLVTTTGVKSGLPRTCPLTLIAFCQGLLATGSNYGRPYHPDWSANLLAHPTCTVEFMGPPARYRAELLTNDARSSAWATVTDLYATYERYRVRCAPREIRVFLLRPV
jgi:deazaflavin-dependent oxidoreductase (nitroreductase family)